MSLARGVILDRHRPRRPSHALQILVPQGYESPEGPVLIGVCHVCTLMGRDTRFHRGEEQAWQRHVGECARRHIDELRAMAPSEVNKGTPFDPENWDPEVDAHMRELGRRMRAEGRFEVKPHERAGFS